MRISQNIRPRMEIIEVIPKLGHTGPKAEGYPAKCQCVPKTSGFGKQEMSSARR